jgi:hypothetical protein
MEVFGDGLFVDRDILPQVAGVIDKGKSDYPESPG